MSEAVERWKENLDVSSPEAEVVIRSYLSEKLVEDAGALWSMQEMNSAMIWWEKNRKS